MTQQQREAIAGMLRASPFDPAGDLRGQRPLVEKMIAAAPVPADVVTTPGTLGGVPVIYVAIPGTTTDGVLGGALCRQTRLRRPRRRPA
jgi:epsilon-lactone hydrolase